MLEDRDWGHCLLLLLLLLSLLFLFISVVSRGKLYKSYECLGCESPKNFISVWHDEVSTQTLTFIHTSSLMTVSY